MTRLAYRFEVDASVPLDEAEMSLHLAMIALEGLFGRAGVRLDARYRLDAAGRAIVVDGSTPLGESLVRVFAALLIREFGDECFVVRRISPSTPAPDPDPAPPNPPPRATSMAAA
jgi:hypothetical protein